MSDNQYFSEQKEETPPTPELMPEQVVTQEMTPVEKMIPLEGSIESTVAEEERHEVQTEMYQGKNRIRKMTRTRQTSAKLGQLLKQAKKNDGEIYEIRKSLETLDRMERVAAKSNLKLMKQVQSQLAQLRSQMVRIQKDFRKMRTSSASRTRFGKNKVSSSKAVRKLGSKKGKSNAHFKTKRRSKTKR